MKFSIREAKCEIKNAITQYFQKDDQGRYMLDIWQQLPIFLLGPAGIGKTQIVADVAKEMNLGFVSYSLVHHTRQTMMGLPVITSFADDNGEWKGTEYTFSELLVSVRKRIEDGQHEGILLLDEANCCSETIQPMLLSFLQSKVLGNSHLPEGWIIVLCGNPPQSIYNNNAKRWDGALMDRLRVIEVEQRDEEYLQYVFDKQLHPAVRLYLTMHLSDAYICERTQEGLDLVTYRTWENLSKALYDYERLGLEITPILINEYIKVNRVVRDFYENYRYSKLDSEGYQKMALKLYKHEIDVGEIRTLREKPVAVLYAITNLYFKQLEIETENMYNRHIFLKEFKNKISGADYNISDMLREAFLPEDEKQELEQIWKSVLYDDALERYVDWHNEKAEQLNAGKGLLVAKLEAFFSELEQLNNTILVTYYLNTIFNVKAWLYIIANTKHDVIDRLAKSLKIDMLEIA